MTYRQYLRQNKLRDELSSFAAYLATTTAYSTWPPANLKIIAKGMYTIRHQMFIG